MHISVKLIALFMSISLLVFMRLPGSTDRAAVFHASGSLPARMVWAPSTRVLAWALWFATGLAAIKRVPGGSRGAAGVKSIVSGEIRGYQGLKP